MSASPKFAPLPPKSNFNSSLSGLPNRFGVYVHIPFCVHKCSYCDFYSFTNYLPEDFQNFTEILCRDIRRKAELLRAKGFETPVSSIFLGGGTPSLLPPKCLSAIFKQLQSSFQWTNDVEITTEANPETLSADLLSRWKGETPINRVSLGVQSFDPRLLKALERLSSPAQVVKSAELLKESGYNNFNMDFIFAIPGQKEEEMIRDLQTAMDLDPRHISAYQLSLKPAHPLYPELPSDDRAVRYYERVWEHLGSNGFPQYEISNFAIEGFECRHNLLYWQGGDFLGVGPSASSRFFWKGSYHHRKELADVARYTTEVEADAPIGFEETTFSQTVLEALFLELRCNDGVSASGFANRYGYDFTKAKKYPLFLREGILNQSEDRVILTAKGRLLADSVSSELVDL